MDKKEFKSIIDERLKELQELLENQIHLSNPEKVRDFITGISKFYGSLSEIDREYFQHAKIAIKDELEWK